MTFSIPVFSGWACIRCNLDIDKDTSVHTSPSSSQAGPAITETIFLHFHRQGKNLTRRFARFQAGQESFYENFTRLSARFQAGQESFYETLHGRFQAGQEITDAFVMSTDTFVMSSS